MAIVEYPQGSEFPGTIGRTKDESSPAFRRRSARRRARPTCSSR